MGKLLSYRFSNIIIDFYFLLECDCAVVYQLLNVCLDTDASIERKKMHVNRNWLQYVGWECADKFLSIMLGDLVVSCPIN